MGRDSEAIKMNREILIPYITHVYIGGVYLNIFYYSLLSDKRQGRLIISFFFF